MRIVNLEDLRVAMRTHHAALGYVRLAARKDGDGEEQLQRWERDVLRTDALVSLGLEDDAEDDDSVVESLADVLADQIREKIEAHMRTLRSTRGAELRFVARFMANKGARTLTTVQLVAYSEDGDLLSNDILRSLEERASREPAPTTAPPADAPPDMPFDLDAAVNAWWKRAGARSRNPVQQALDLSVELMETARIGSAYVSQNYQMMIGQKDRRIAALERQLETLQNARARQQNQRDADFEQRAKEEREARQRWDFANKSLERLEAVARDAFGMSQVSELLPLLEALTPETRALLSRQDTRDMLRNPESQAVLRTLIERSLIARQQAAEEAARDAAGVDTPPEPPPEHHEEENPDGQ